MNRKTGTNTLLNIMLLLFVVTSIAVFVFSKKISDSLIRTMAIDSASLYSDALNEFRSVYSSEVINRLSHKSAIDIRHDYADHVDAIPLPATLSMLLGRNIGEHLAGAHTYLYSPFPFPWRESEGINSEFRKNAWQALSNAPKEPYYEFVDFEGRGSIRFAVADVMGASCVECHNQHPDTPKNDWQVGDVRGVLEVIQPLDTIIKQADESASAIQLLAVVAMIFGLTSVVLFVLQEKRNSKGLQVKLEETKKKVICSQEDLAKSEKLAALGLVSVGIAHEINQPLGAAKLTLEMLVKQSGTKGFGIESKLDRLLRQIDRIDGIIKQLNVSTRETQSLKTELVDLNQLVHRVTTWLNEELTLEGIKLTIAVDENLPKITANEVEIERVITNLITNAMHAMRDVESPKEITVKSGFDDSAVWLLVADTGKGVPESIRNKIFDPFFTTKEVGQGMGMGLSLCRGILQKYNGEISLKTVTDLPNEGDKANPMFASEFTIKFKRTSGSGATNAN